MEIPSKYSPTEIEERWYRVWVERGYFNSQPDHREPYTIVIPPPNVTGVLHMGHMLNNTIQDLLARRARMLGKNCCWVPGTDHASIATEAKVVEKLKSEGVEKSSLTRDQFLEEAWSWKERHGGIILEQLKKLGVSCDWDRLRFTMDQEMSSAVINSFLYFYKKGLIYRGIRMVNWDPVGQTAVSDEEVIHRETPSKLYYLKYYISEDGVGTEEYLTVATTRPETIMADSALCIHPQDKRYQHLKGKKVVIPLINKEIPIIEDSYVEMEFGTGVLKITPAHDINDYKIGLEHNLPSIDIFDQYAKLNESAQILVGEDRFVARKKIVKMLEESGSLIKVEEHSSQIGFSERTDAVIEPRLSLQWFLKMEELAAPALKAVLDKRIRLVPEKYTNTYRHWMENVKDWCISRQLWWGQQIPAWYLPSGEVVVAKNSEEALAEAKKIDPTITADTLIQDEDVLDTWFSSWLWPISVFDPQKPGFPNKEPNRDLAYYYPTDDLVTAPEILFFWVARMVMAGLEFCHEVPFKTVYLTGIVRDKMGRKMSKSLGNSPDPIKLIEEFGADGVRVGMLLCSSAGNDILFDESQVEQGRNFANKIWNAFRLVEGWEGSSEVEITPQAAKGIEWFDHLLQESIAKIDEHFSHYRLSDALMLLYKLFWDDFCSWYLEIVKPPYSEPLNQEVINSTKLFFDTLLRLLHPFMPFITEELWQKIEKRSENESITHSPVPTPKNFDRELIDRFEVTKGIITNIRNLRHSKGISAKEPLTLYIEGDFDWTLSSLIEKMANVEKIYTMEKRRDEQSGSSFISGTLQLFIPLEGMLDLERELEKIESEIARLNRFIIPIKGKLSNTKFLDSAPQNIVERERKKLSDSEIKLAALLEMKRDLTK
ncbi:MAG: valine--tRNA ligase [Bacteroidales bacterium]